MTFTQNSGNPVSFIGTDSNDTLVLTAGQPFSGVIDPSGTYDGGAAFVQAEGGNDIVTTNGNVAGVTIYGGSGNDDIAANGNGDVGQFTNGQVFLDDGTDLFTYFNLVTTGVNGGDGNDTISAGSNATSTASSINGNAGSDVIFILGRAGDTGIYGGRDADTISVSTTTFFTSSVINGNKGADLINIVQTGNASSWSGTEIRGGADSDTINLIAGNADLGGVYGDLGQDQIVATVLGGATGAGTVSSPFAQTFNSAYAGDISAFGGDGNDSIVGGAGFDTLDGGLNADVLNGAAGDDTLTGGDGTYSDTFVFGNGQSAYNWAASGATSLAGASATFAGAAATLISAQMASIDGLIGSDLVTDYDLADDNIRISQSTLGFPAANALFTTLNAGYTGTFGVSTDGTNVTFFDGVNGDGTATDSPYALIYNQTTGDLFYAIDTAGDLSSINTVAELTTANSHLIATLDTTPSINGSNYTNEIFVIA